MATVMLRHGATRAQNVKRRALAEHLSLGSRLDRLLEAQCASCGGARSRGLMTSGSTIMAGSSSRRGRRSLTASATSLKKKDEEPVSLPPTSPQVTGSKPGVATQDEKEVKSALRSLLREVAQPVAVVTSFMPPGHSKPNSSHSPGHSPRIPLQSHSHEHQHQSNHHHHRFHGATLSSFSSIAMDPHPLVAFALRVPSRMAATLEEFLPGALAPSSYQEHQYPDPHLRDASNTHLVLNILSDTQHPLAHAFSRPDLHPHPFSTARYILNRDGLPILEGSLGALACRVVGRVTLSELGWAEGERERRRSELGRHHGGVVSELFIARVVRVEEAGVLQKGDSEDVAEVPKPLLYWRRGYTGCRESS